jgi:hypothetical protein
MIETAIPEEPEEMDIPNTFSGEHPLRADIPLPLLGVFHPLGFTVEIATNSREVLEAAEETWRYPRKNHLERPVELRIAVSPGKSRECPPPPVYREQRKLFSVISDAENFIVSDLGQGFGFGWLTNATVRNRAFLRYHFLEVTALGLLASLYLTPLHGACVRLGGKGVLLCGDSGAGKSTLAYACARSGWTLVSDDSSYLIRGGDGRTIVGNPHQVRFREPATQLFPELQGLSAVPRPTGKLAIEVATSSLPQIATSGESSIDYIVFLNRRTPDATTLAAVSKDSARRWFEQTLWLGDEEIRDAQAASLQTLLGAEVLELRYRDLGWAVKRLELLVQEGS